jgi:orotate phosphoribosyltransferase
MQEAVLDLLSSRKGHFLLESGHHGDFWLELELLWVRPQAMRPLAAEFARRMEKLREEAVYSPLVEGAFVGLLVASELDIEFYYSERFAQSSRMGCSLLATAFLRHFESGSAASASPTQTM